MRLVHYRANAQLPSSTHNFWYPTAVRVKGTPSSTNCRRMSVWPNLNSIPTRISNRRSNIANA